MTTLYFAILVIGIFILITWWLFVWTDYDGEKYVSKYLRNLDPLKYKVLNDVMLPSRGNTTSTQIDHIVVSNYGIICIETKSHKGWIFGNANQEYWTQVIFHYKGKFYNPLRQNYAHVKAIEGVLRNGRLNKSIVSLVVFTDADRLNISGTDSVGYACDIVSKIECYKDPVFSDAERDAIYGLLTNSNIHDKKTRKLHIKEVRDLKKY